MIKSFAACAIVAIGLGGCNPNDADTGIPPWTPSSGISQAVKDKIALCNAGSSTTLSLNLAARIGQTLQEGGSVTATAGDELRGLFLARPGITEENAVSLYNSYVGCLNGPTG